MKTIALLSIYIFISYNTILSLDSYLSRQVCAGCLWQVSEEWKGKCSTILHTICYAALTNWSWGTYYCLRIYIYNFPISLYFIWESTSTFCNLKIPLYCDCESQSAIFTTSDLLWKYYYDKTKYKSQGLYNVHGSHIGVVNTAKKKVDRQWFRTKVLRHDKHHNISWKKNCFYYLVCTLKYITVFP